MQRASQAVPRTTRRPASSRCGCPKVRFNWVGPIVMGFMVLLAAGLLSGPAAVSLAKSLADMTQDVSRLTTAGANLTITVSEAAVAFGRGSANVAYEAWTGVDILDAAAHVHGAKWIMHKSMVGPRFLSSEIGRMLVPWNDTQKLLTAMQAVSPVLPLISQREVDWLTNGSYVRIHFQVVQMQHHFIGVEVIVANLSFGVQWCNPVWHMLELNPSAQLPGLKNKLREALVDLPATAFDPNSFGPTSTSVLTLRPTLMEDWVWRLRHWWCGQYMLA